MKLIAGGKDAIELLTDNESLLSGKLVRFSAYLEDDRLYLDLDIILLYSNRFKHITLRFVDVVEYSFYYNIKHHFYNIENYKLFVTNDQIYISLDPVDGSSIEIDEHDNDFVIAGSLEVYAKI